MVGGIFQGTPSRLMDFLVHLEQANDSPRRFSSNKRQTTSVQSKRGKMHAPFGLYCGTGEVRIRKDILVVWGIGQRPG